MIQLRPSKGIITLVLLIFIGQSSLLFGQAALPIIRYDTIHHPQTATGGMVVSQRMIASEVGGEILEAGGNAIDAAVAVGLALAVALPRAGNLGGGGFMMVHLAEEARTIAIDYREMAPAAAHENVYVRDDGSVDDNAHRASHRAAGVPGSVAGFAYALENYGTMTWAEVIAPAIMLADAGIVLDQDTASAINSRTELLSRTAAGRAIFFREDGTNYQAGDLFRQADLAKTLRTLSADGPQAFYTGSIADLIVAEMEANNGLITHADLAAYRPVEREPVTGSYRGYSIASMPPPSSGGVHLVQMLNVLEQFPVGEMQANSAASLHLLTETMRRAYADRSQHLGDPDFFEVPMTWLTHKAYGKELAAQIDPERATPSEAIAPGVETIYESEDTTHFSVMDADGNAVSNTYTLNFSFGSGIVVEGAGFLLNNEMADFSAKAGVPYAFGLLGGEANSVQPGKRPLSAMTPTMLFRYGKPVLITGSPGGSRIITTVLQQIVNVVDHGMNIASATHSPRIHHQWFPDELSYEPGISSDSLNLLRQREHNIVEANTMGSLQSIMRRDGILEGATDPRRPGGGVVGVD